MKNFLALLIFAGGAAGWYLYNQDKAAKESLDAAQIQLQEVEKLAASRGSEFTGLTALAKLRQQVAALQTEHQNRSAKLKEVQDAVLAIKKERSDALKSAREALVGTTLDLTLTTGRKLGQVKVNRVEDQSLSVATSTGVVKVLPNELPLDLKGKFLYTY